VSSKSRMPARGPFRVAALDSRAAPCLAMRMRSTSDDRSFRLSSRAVGSCIAP
jgi:hypothetical protein